MMVLIGKGILSLQKQKSSSSSLICTMVKVQIAVYLVFLHRTEKSLSDLG